MNLIFKLLNNVVFSLQVIIRLLQKTRVIEVLTLNGLIVLAELDDFGTDLTLQRLYLVLEEFVCELDIPVSSLEFLILIAQFIIRVQQRLRLRPYPLQIRLIPLDFILIYHLVGLLALQPLLHIHYDRVSLIDLRLQLLVLSQQCFLLFFHLLNLLFEEENVAFEGDSFGTFFLELLSDRIGLALDVVNELVDVGRGARGKGIGVSWVVEESGRVESESIVLTRF